MLPQVTTRVNGPDGKLILIEPDAILSLQKALNGLVRAIGGQLWVS